MNTYKNKVAHVHYKMFPTINIQKLKCLKALKNSDIFGKLVPYLTSVDRRRNLSLSSIENSRSNTSFEKMDSVCDL